ncbi:hypothetical protein BRC67_05150 [Halobacteriales archaeon QH_3_68_24]|nr:MAG: hypothetical protein BRC67_05150 [Halobacteriales archaeon QH_3_68_24]
MDRRVVAAAHVVAGLAAVVASVAAGGVPNGSGVDTWPATAGVGYVVLGGLVLRRSRWDVRSSAAAGGVALPAIWTVRVLGALADENLLALQDILGDATVSVLFVAPAVLAFPFGVALSSGERRSLAGIGGVAAAAVLVAFAVWDEGLVRVGAALWVPFLSAIAAILLLFSIPPAYLGRLADG